MTRAKLFNPKARKQFECRGEGPKHFIKPGEKYWCVTAMRQQPARFCDAHKPTDEYVSNFGPKSRADRAGDCADQFNDAGTQLNEIAEEIGHILDEPMEEELKEGETEENAPLTADQVERLLKLKPRLEEIGPDGSDFTALAEALRSWADNMSGTGLENVSAPYAGLQGPPLANINTRSGATATDVEPLAFHSSAVINPGCTTSGTPAVGSFAGRPFCRTGASSTVDGSRARAGRRPWSSDPSRG
jgi:hypothetical protein